MPELPEIFNLARQMNTELTGKKVAKIEVRQEKCLNMPVVDFEKLVIGKTIGSITSRGKWVFTKLEPDVYFLLSLGMGGNVLLHKSAETLPEKYQLKFDFNDHTSLSIGFWWFGYAHAVMDRELGAHKMTADLGICPMRAAEFTYDKFAGLLKGKKGGIKSFLMDQKHIAGIGNVYIQDILFRAGLHPNRKISAINTDELRTLYQVIGENIKNATQLGGLVHEKDLYDQPGRFKDFLVGYKEGKPCPTCGTAIQKIKTGSTATFICSECQK